MIRFKRTPDAVFQSILRKSIDYAVDVISDLLQVFNLDDGGTRREFMSLFPEIGRVFPPSVAKAALIDLRNCVDSPDVYSGTEYHYLMLYDVLNFYADIHNGLVIKAKNKKKRKEAAFVDPFSIERIHVDEMLDLYFLDENFLLDADTLQELPERARKSMRPELFGLCQGLQPHPEELELKMDERSNRRRLTMKPSEFFGPRSTEYPDFSYHDSITPASSRVDRED
jgi:hypothetical protein